MHPAISINTLSLAPDRLDRQVNVVARLGARAISPDLMHVDEFGVAETARTIRDAKLEIATLTHRAFGFVTDQEAADARARLERTIGIAGEIGAKTILMTTGGRAHLSWGDAAERFAAAVRPCADLAEKAGIRLGIEPTSHLYADSSIVHRLADTTAVARKAGLYVIPDIFACWVDSDIEAAIADAGSSLAMIQVADYVYGDRGLPCRAVPGDGAVPFERIVPAIMATGFTGYFDLEIIGPRLQEEGQEAGLMRGAEYLGKLIDSCKTSEQGGSDG